VSATSPIIQRTHSHGSPGGRAVQDWREPLPVQEPQRDEYAPDEGGPDENAPEQHDDPPDPGLGNAQRDRARELEQGEQQRQRTDREYRKGRKDERQDRGASQEQPRPTGNSPDGGDERECEQRLENGREHLPTDQAGEIGHERPHEECRVR
jgi:hypothetical protein